MPNKTIKTQKNTKGAWYKSPMAILVLIAVFLIGSLSAFLVLRTNATGTLAPPTNLVGSAQSPTSVMLNWTWSTTPNIWSYNVFRNGVQIDVANVGVYIQGTTSMGYMDTTAQPNTTYTYYVQAFNSDGVANSNTLTVTTPPQPTAAQLGTLQGTVSAAGKGKKGTAGSPISGATVSIIYYGVFHTAPTDATGHYAFTGIPAGLYAPYVYAPNYTGQTLPNMTLNEGGTLTANAVLQPRK